MTFDQASVCVKREPSEWKYQKMSEVGGLAYTWEFVLKRQSVAVFRVETELYDCFIRI